MYTIKIRIQYEKTSLLYNIIVSILYSKTACKVRECIYTNTRAHMYIYMNIQNRFKYTGTLLVRSGSPP